MAYSVTIKNFVLALTLICVSVTRFNLGKADDYLPQIGAEDENLPHSGGEDENLPKTGAVGADPAQVVAKALLCFNDKYIYSHCEEEYRLTQSGNLNVPPEYVDQYCEGPCLTETHLVLSCIENILSHFLFYNEATIKDVRETIKDACGHGDKRGDFNVAEHIKVDEDGSAHMGFNSLLFGLVLVILGMCTF